jgi:predicted Zn-dependent protease with MMP-like domain
MCNTIDELEEQIEITVVHEIAHFLGISEERLAELGYG